MNYSDWVKMKGAKAELIACYEEAWDVLVSCGLVPDQVAAAMLATYLHELYRKRYSDGPKPLWEDEDNQPKPFGGLDK